MDNCMIFSPGGGEHGDNMGRDYAKQKHKAGSKTGSFSDGPASPTDSLPLLGRSPSTQPKSPNFPNTPAQSFRSTFDTEDGGDLEPPPTVSTLGSPPLAPCSRPSGRRGSSFSDKLRRGILDKIVDPTVKARREEKQKLKKRAVLEKESTNKLNNFWKLVQGSEAAEYDPSNTALTTISEDPLLQPASRKAASIGEKFKFHSSPPKKTKLKPKMDPSRLAPLTYEAPKRALQIQDAKDMYTTVVRNAERAGSEVPPYDFIELIGKGGFGRVYKCRERATGELVAVKILNIDDFDFNEHVLDKDNSISSFRKEVAILQQLKDNRAKNINMIHDAFDLHNQLWIVSDYCTGGSLRTLMRASPKRGFEEHFIIPVARELAVALKSVHDIGVIHRDIKCSNVYVNEEGHIQLGDFGIIGELDDGNSKRRTIVGTPHYLPLEIQTSMEKSKLQTDEAYGTEIDIWAYGITMFEMATGTPPHANVPMGRLAEVSVNPPRLESGDYSDELRDFVAFCLNGDPKLRPSAEQLLQHPYIAGTEKKYPTNNLVKLIERFIVWEYGGGQRSSLWMAGGAAAPVVGEEGEDDEEEVEDSQDWNFSTSDSFNNDFGRRYSQLVGTQDFAEPQFDAPAGSGLPPIVTKDLSRMEQVEQHFKDLSANRGERSLDRLFNPESKPYELHTPDDDDNEPLSDLPLRNFSGTAPTRESMIDLDSAAGLDITVPTFNFDFGDIPTLRARNLRQGPPGGGEEEEYQYESHGNDEKRATMEWTFPTPVPAQEKKRATMDWSFARAEPLEPDDPEPLMNLPPLGSEGLPPGFRPTLKHTMTQPVGQFNDFMHPPQPLAPVSSSPMRDSMSSMVDLDMGLADPAEIVRPSTASSATGSTSTDFTSGNPFDLEEDPAQLELDRNRFSYHKQWQSEGGRMKRASHKTMPMHSRGSSLTSTDSELDGIAREPTEDVFDYDYSRKISDAMRTQISLQIPENEASMNHWPNFGSDSGLDEIAQYENAFVPQLGDPDFPLQQGMQGMRTNGKSSMFAQLRSQAPQRDLEFPDTVAPHPDTLVEEADPQMVAGELDRLLEDFGQSMKATATALRQHTGVQREDGSSETDSGMESSAMLSEDEGYRM